jgi:23S rRNA (uridine2552-2'-O)-methyltransferase
VFNQIMRVIAGAPVDLVISDMAPNLSGIAAADQAASIYLIELALDLARQVLKPRGSFIAKAFQGEGYEPFVKALRNEFDQVVIRKPQASRSRSREVYLVGKGLRS